MLIWQLRAERKFDELSNEEKMNLLKIFPDAPIRFGNNYIKGISENYLGSIVPSEVKEIEAVFKDAQNKIDQYKGDYNRIRNLINPPPAHSIPVDPGWIDTNEGYFIHIKSSAGFSKVHVDIYVPDSNENQRAISSKKVFRPWAWLLKPFKGQRIVMGVSNTSKSKSKKQSPCEKLKSWKPDNCKNIDDSVRGKLLEISSPDNFKTTRYASPPAKNAKIEEQTDCSNFVNEIYRRAGLDYHYSPTNTMNCISTFNEVDDSDKKPGDVILYNGHTGILDKNLNVISTTRGGDGHRSMLPVGDADFKSSITSYPINTFKGQYKILRWKCP